MNDLVITNAKVWTLDEPGTLEKGWLAAKDGGIKNRLLTFYRGIGRLTKI